jgi:hypothetical protein
MVTDLERRRLAIADALRAVMAEPLPEPLPEFTPAVTAPTRIATPMTISELLPARETLAASIEWDEFEGLTEADDPVAVPPLEVAGSMSRAASVALFGHA